MTFLLLEISKKNDSLVFSGVAHFPLSVCMTEKSDQRPGVLLSKNRSMRLKLVKLFIGDKFIP